MNTLSEMKISVTLATIIAVLSAGFGAGAAWVSLNGRISTLERDLSLRDSLTLEIRGLRDSVESRAHDTSERNDALQFDHIQSIREALARKGITVN